MNARDVLARLIFRVDNGSQSDQGNREDWEALERSTQQGKTYAHNIADGLLESGWRQVFDGDCGLSSITDPTDREAAEAWMRFSNIVLGNGQDGIAAMKQMLAEFGYRKAKP